MHVVLCYTELTALAIRIKLFGEEHESTAASYRKLGVTQASMYDYTSALESHQCELAIRIKQFGEEQESTADCYKGTRCNTTRNA